ncbi:MAG: hypothetical protein OK457_05935 [Thaumarchaeota archaeon]|nr:hypothetical protein [Nitrososphaerota archaeon]
MLDVSYVPDRPDSVMVYADGRDARILKKLISLLGSEENAQNALILTGFLSKIEKKGGMAFAARAGLVKESFRELVGVSYQEYGRILETL